MERKPARSPVDVLFLDVMDTLVRDPFRDAMPAFFGMTLSELIPQLKHGPWVEFEKSERDEASFLRDFFADGRTFDHDAFLRAVTAAYEFLPGIPELLRDLRGAGLRLYALSNYPCWYERIDAKLGLEERLDGSFVSYRMGVRKPHEDAYLIPARTVGVEPERALFVDDRASNCEAARGVGMSAIRFEGADSLRESLRAEGILAER